MINIHFSQRTFIALCGLILALILLITSFYLWEWKTDWDFTHHPLLNEPTVETVVDDKATSRIAAITTHHLFGQALTGDVPLTNLQLRVTGIVKTLLQNVRSKAYISIAGQPSKIFQTGDELPYGVKIYDITAQAVIVENNGRLEKILLPREKLLFKARENEEIL